MIRKSVRVSFVGCSLIVVSAWAFAQSSVATDEAQIRQLIAKPAADIPRTADSIHWSGPYTKPSVGKLVAELTDPAVLAARVPDSFASKTEVVRLEVSRSGDFAYEFSNFDATFKLKTGETQAFTGSLLRVWKKEDGQWKQAALFIRPHQQTGR